MKTEFEFINAIRSKYSLGKIGDDCAILPKNSKYDQVITTDLLVEDIDFRREWTTPEFLGHKALAVSLSDVAAMGGNPTWSMLSIGIPEVVWKTDFVDRFYAGYFELAKRFDVELIGGDVSKTSAKIVVDSIAAGEVHRGKAVKRTGAMVGDLIFTTGPLGGAAMGLRLLEENKEGFEEVKHLQLRPFPRVFEGLFLSKIATSMIDISDGLSSDLQHLCESSNVGARIRIEQIPVNRLIQDITNDFDEQLNLALNGGEDFELLFTTNSKKKLATKFPAFTCIGEVTASVGIIELIDGEKTRVLEPKGFAHF